MHSFLIMFVSDLMMVQQKGRGTPMPRPEMPQSLLLLSGHVLLGGADSPRHNSLPDDDAADVEDGAPDEECEEDLLRLYEHSLGVHRSTDEVSETNVVENVWQLVGEDNEAEYHREKRDQDVPRSSNALHRKVHSTYCEEVREDESYETADGDLSELLPEVLFVESEEHDVTNKDSPSEVNEAHLYAECLNDPVHHHDPDKQEPAELVDKFPFNQFRIHSCHVR